jgi:Fur family ferric uptake transcriptional regulator
MQLICAYDWEIVMRPRWTGLRKEILRVIDESEKPLNAKAVMNRIPFDPNLSTVYRALDFLEREKCIQSVSFSRIKFYYTETEKCGGHFLFCDSCHEIRGFDECVAADLIGKIQAQFKYTITGHVLYLQGVCSDCQTYQNKKVHELM